MLQNSFVNSFGITNEFKYGWGIVQYLFFIFSIVYIEYSVPKCGPLIRDGWDQISVEGGRWDKVSALFFSPPVSAGSGEEVAAFCCLTTSALAVGKII